MKPKDKRAKILILGVGNTIRGDDGVGIFVTRLLKEQIDSPDVDIKETERAGMDLLDMMAGYEKVIIIDSIRADNGKPGMIHRFKRGDFKKKDSPFSSHQFGLATIFKLAKLVRLEMPKDIIIYGMGVERSDYFSEQITSKVKERIPEVSKQIKKEVVKWQYKP